MTLSFFARRPRRARRPLAAAAVTGVAMALLTGVAAPSGAVGGTPFDCAAGFYQVSKNGTGSSFWRYDVGTNAFTQVGSGYASANVNGIGYDTDDNYLYGFAGSTLLRIDKLGAFVSQGTVSAGTVSGGDYYNHRLLVAPNNSNSWNSVDVTGPTASAFTLTGAANGTAASATWGAYDLTVIGDMAYGLNNTTLYLVDLATRHVASRTISGPTTGNYGAAYSDTTGNLFFYNNSDGKVFEVTKTELAKATTASTPTAVLVGGAASTPSLTAPNDGASCALAASPYAPVIATGSASGVTTTTATLGATITANNSATTAQFCWSTVDSEAGCTPTAATPSSITGSTPTAISGSLSGLTPGTTYYVWAQAENAVSPNSQRFTFTTQSLPAQTITFDQPADMTVGDADQALTATADSGLDVTVTSTTPSVCTVAGSPGSWTVTAVDAGTCSLTASRGGNASYSAAPDVVRTLTVSAAPTPDPTTSTPDPTTSTPDPTTSTPDPTTSTPESTTPPATDPVDDAADAAWDGDVLVDVLANDPDGAALAAVVDAPAHGTAVIESGKIRYTPNGHWAGTDTFTYGIDGTDAVATVTVSVTGPTAPAAVDDAVTTPSATHLSVDVLDNDTGTDLTVTAVGEATNGTTTLTSGVVGYTPDAGFKGTDTFTYTVTDAVGATETATVTVTVANHAPTLSVTPPSPVVAGSTVDIPLTLGDPNEDDDVVVTVGTLSGGSDRTGLTATIVDRDTLHLVLPTSYTGLLSVPLQADDGDVANHTANATVVLRVLPRAATAARYTTLVDTSARNALRTPVFVRGVPVSRTLSTRLTSTVTWTASATSSVTRYVVTINGVARCTVTASGPGRTHTCLLPDLGLNGGDAVRIVAYGADTSASSPAAAAFRASTAATGHLVAVVYFTPDGKVLDANAQAVLSRAATLARKYGLTTVTLAGHTDSDGTDAYNLKLSLNRATAVRTWVNRHLPGLSVTSAGFGERQPILPNSSKRNKSANRRVEVYLS